MQQQSRRKRSTSTLLTKSLTLLPPTLTQLSPSLSFSSPSSSSSSKPQLSSKIPNELKSLTTSSISLNSQLSTSLLQNPKLPNEITSPVGPPPCITLTHASPFGKGLGSELIQSLTQLPSSSKKISSVSAPSLLQSSSSRLPSSPSLSPSHAKGSNPNIPSHAKGPNPNANPNSPLKSLTKSLSQSSPSLQPSALPNSRAQTELIQTFVASHVELLTHYVPFRMFYIEGERLYIALNQLCFRKLISCASKHHFRRTSPRKHHHHHHHHRHREEEEDQDHEEEHEHEEKGDLFTFLNQYAKLDCNSVLRQKFSDPEKNLEFWFPYYKLPEFVDYCNQVFDIHIRTSPRKKKHRKNHKISPKGA